MDERLNLYVYDKNDVIKGFIKNISSIQWLEYYNETGQFSISALPTEQNIDFFVEGNRIVNINSGTIGFIELVLYNEYGLEVKGHLDNLNDRINIRTAQIKDVPNDLNVLVTNNLRGIDIKTDDTSMDETTQVMIETTWKPLRETISEVCKQVGWGYRMVRQKAKIKGENPRLNVLEFYKGKLTKAVFSEEIGNVIIEEYMRDSSQYKNYAYVAGEGEGVNRKVAIVDNSNGGEKFELYVDAKDIRMTWTDQDNVEHQYTEEEYNKILISKGENKLQEYKKKETFKMEIPLEKKTFKYNVDYKVGDIVTVKSEKFNILKKIRLAGIKTIQEEDGVKTMGIIEEVLNDTKMLSVR